MEDTNPRTSDGDLVELLFSCMMAAIVGDKFGAVVCGGDLDFAGDTLIFAESCWCISDDLFW